jgi:hypothetical protein
VITIQEGDKLNTAQELIDQLRKAPADGLVWLVAVLEQPAGCGEAQGVVALHERAAALMDAAGVDTRSMGDALIHELQIVMMACKLVHEPTRMVGARLVNLRNAEQVDLVVTGDAAHHEPPELRRMLAQLQECVCACLVAHVQHAIDTAPGAAGMPHRHRPQGDA